MPNAKSSSPCVPVNHISILASLSRHTLQTLLWAGLMWTGSLPAQAQPDPVSVAQAQLSQIESWQFDSQRGRLEITTVGGTRPSLFVLENPSRVVLDFPNAQLREEARTVPYPGRVESVRTQQMSETISRFILQMAPGQTIRLDDLQLLTANSQRWAVQFLPDPGANGNTTAREVPPWAGGAAPLPPVTSNPPSLIPPPSPLATAPPPPLLLGSPPSGSAAPPPLLLGSPPSPSSPAAPPPLLTPPAPASGAGGRVQLQSLSATNDGFLVRTSGPANATVRRVPNPDRIVVDMLNTTLSPALAQRALTVNQLGVRTLRVGQFEPSVARVVLDVDPTVGDWEARYDPQQGGLKIVPAGGASQASLLPDAPSNIPPGDGSQALIQAVQLSGDQLTISADGFLFYRSGWDPDTGAYRINVRPARLPSTLPDPGLPPNGPIDRIRFVQESADTVSILVQPARDFNIVEPNPGQGSRRITLQLQSLDGSPIAPPLPAQPQPIAPAPPVPGQVVIAVDPGHGGRDPGAIGVGGVQEKVVNLDISNRVAQRLQAAGYGVIMTRTDDREVLLQPRVDAAVRGNATLFVSIHTNALDRSGVRGIETYYLRPDSERLATTLHRSIVAGASGTPDRGVRRARFFVVRETPVGMPSVLLELGYLTNPEEGRLLATPEYRDQLAEAVAQGILAYLQNR